jgi:hypothetical protein
VIEMSEGDDIEPAVLGEVAEQKRQCHRVRPAR